MSQASEEVRVDPRHYHGSSLDDFLKEEGVFEETQASAIEEIAAWLKEQ
jgi:hypothetical protein